MKKNVLCILCCIPHSGNLRIATDIVRHTSLDVIILTDKPYKPPETVDQRIQFVHITDEECSAMGYKLSCSISFSKEVVAWDKALYYFANIHTEYDFVWLMEDDIFISSYKTIQDLTDKYANVTDVAISNVIEFFKGYEKQWAFWQYVVPYMRDCIYLAARVCAVGVSRNFFSSVKSFMAKANRIPFIEGFIPTLALNHNLNMISIPEFAPIANCIHTPMCDMPLHCNSYDTFGYEEFKVLSMTHPDKVFHAIKDEKVYNRLLDLFDQDIK